LICRGFSQTGAAFFPGWGLPGGPGERGCKEKGGGGGGGGFGPVSANPGFWKGRGGAGKRAPKGAKAGGKNPLSPRHREKKGGGGRRGLGETWGGRGSRSVFLAGGTFGAEAPGGRGGGPEKGGAHPADGKRGGLIFMGFWADCGGTPGRGGAPETKGWKGGFPAFPPWRGEKFLEKKRGGSACWGAKSGGEGGGGPGRDRGGGGGGTGGTGVRGFFLGAPRKEGGAGFDFFFRLFLPSGGADFRWGGKRRDFGPLWGGGGPFRPEDGKQRGGLRTNRGHPRGVRVRGRVPGAGTKQKKILRGGGRGWSRTRLGGGLFGVLSCGAKGAGGGPRGAAAKENHSRGGTNLLFFGAGIFVVFPAFPPPQAKSFYNPPGPFFLHPEK